MFSKWKNKVLNVDLYYLFLNRFIIYSWIIIFQKYAF